MKHFSDLLAAQVLNVTGVLSITGTQLRLDYEMELRREREILAGSEVPILLM